MSSGGKFLLGLGAFAAGVAVGLLIAPKSGKELREDIKKKVKGFPDLYKDDLNGVDVEISGRDLEEQLIK
ncbi:MAG: YtxH domain-containing protein [Chloroherpetonaceae bacterium]|nr:YtxH domain-containing protein [Chloroherpetonaceae bacterium]